ncbi:hypothetical protein BASA50_006765 [Batrachochytrium salamandrivorans]|uniref:Ribokinase n=1 Tax=Batrachochytrium salamandrivorans TaxID=1357716 RepID=A0ABQ8FA99_9FUNG|nr:hypothetical protein BASA62_001401 [Batrachochytrium salamandrivorans]KAH6580159.1 hypothetical protein BASA60_002976 [Batrachochytrium salamandrivorans]KAH6594294.1 hypothetical protein BASA50_006765 [Batrachochytrium salamandrivorans]
MTTAPKTFPRALCFGSINIDDVFTVPEIVKPGETISCSAYTMLPGGKGANQSVALAKSGISVVHGGKIGTDGKWVLDLMQSYGADTSMVVVDKESFTGRAIIQVSDASRDNAIVLNPGANHQITTSDIDKVLAEFGPGEFALLQNELNVDATVHLLRSCAQKGMIVCLNPAPCPSNLASQIPLEFVDILILNEPESESLLHQLSTSSLYEAACKSPTTICEAILNFFPSLSVMIITLGEKGLVAGARSEHGGSSVVQSVSVTRAVQVQDTTGAGDTFVGYCCGHLISAMRTAIDPTSPLDKQSILSSIALKSGLLTESLKVGILAAGVCCEHDGAMIAIPTKSELMNM